MITCLALSPSLDVTYLVDSLRIGGISRPTRTRKVAGGKGLNVARSAARLGAPVRAVAVLGGRTGELIADLLAGTGVGLDPVPVEEETRTCVSIAASDDDRLTEVYEASPPLNDSAWAAVEERMSTVGQDDWVVLSGSVPGGIGPARLSALVRAVAASGGRVAVDTHGPALAHILDARPAVVKVNRSEAAEVLGVAMEVEIADLARALRERTGGVVVVTDGPDGSTAVDREEVVRIPGDSQRGRYPVGSGDGYTAGLVVGLSRGQDLGDAARLGAACATANAAIPGAGDWSVEEMERVLKRLPRTDAAPHPEGD